MKKFLDMESRIWAGQTVLRVLMNRAFMAYTLTGSTIDVGGGRNPDYFNFFKKGDHLSIAAVDASISIIDLEKDPLPYSNASAETVLCANLLEHIYDYHFVVREMYRVLKPGGVLVGFVPFLQQYHPDPHDYFRYTDEALQRIFQDAGFVGVNIERVGGGPFLVYFNMIVLSLPRLVAVLVYPWYACMDFLFLTLRPTARNRYPLGFVFTGRKAVSSH